ncbi:MAG: cytochrome c [Myxococcales bacterium]|nr:cytochrome c [Myxococcales bacterium]
MARRTLRQWGLLLGALALATSACDPPGLPNQGSTTATTAARPSTPGGESTAPPSPEAVREGQGHFERACARCHTGDEPSGGRLNDLRVTAARIDEVLHAGSDDHLGLMPALAPGQLTEAQLPALVAYLRSIAAVR